ncbi:hypothetical protein CY0110_18997 [Crocosphaera chwakensis CCY0110]|uniref:Uncharacterized protein n=1 Tax=Crocosphaera chwakensis CCY0110 TaxID=391612 RepID=A3IJD1_9CHRO|nr:hypothetical protein CY0110_18997 [Crocosphaera chwakensis CCY0110]
MSWNLIMVKRRSPMMVCLGTSQIKCSVFNCNCFSSAVASIFPVNSNFCSRVLYLPSSAETSS